MPPLSEAGRSALSTKVSVIAVVAALYAVGKGLTGPIPFPYSVGEVLIAVFIPAFFVVVSDTLPVAIGAGIGTFLGDYFVRTTPAISLVAGVPANFIAILLLGFFVKRYRSWPSFVAAVVAFVTLGNLIAALNVVLFLGLNTSLIPGFVVAWNITGIPAIIVGVPVLVRAVRPLFGRTRMITNLPEWSGILSRRQLIVSLAFPLFYTALGAVVYLVYGLGLGLGTPVASGSIGLIYFGLAAVLLLLFGPLFGAVGGGHPRATPAAA